MRCLICYDIVSNRSRNKMAKVLLDFGVRVQKSAFECELSRMRLRELLRRAKPLLDEQTDSLRIYRMCADCAEEIQVLGVDFKRPDLPTVIIL